MSTLDPYKHIRDLARSIMRREMPIDGEAAIASETPCKDELATVGPPKVTEVGSVTGSSNGHARRKEIDIGTIATTLKAARLRKGLTQRELGQLAGIPQSHVSKIESGVVDIRLSSVLALAKLLDLRFELKESDYALPPQGAIKIKESDAILDIAAR